MVGKTPHIFFKCGDLTSVSFITIMTVNDYAPESRDRGKDAYKRSNTAVFEILAEIRRQHKTAVQGYSMAILRCYAGFYRDDNSRTHRPIHRLSQGS